MSNIITFDQKHKISAHTKTHFKLYCFLLKGHVKELNSSLLLSSHMQYLCHLPVIQILSTFDLGFDNLVIYTP